MILLQVSYPEYQFKSTSGYLEHTQTQFIIEDNSFISQTNQNKPGPKKVSGIDGWLFWLLWGRANGVPSDATNNDLYDYYDYVQSGGILSYKDWWNNKYNPTPIGDINLLLLLIFSGIYIMIKRKKETRWLRKLRNHQKKS